MLIERDNPRAGYRLRSFQPRQQAIGRRTAEQPSLVNNSTITGMRRSSARADNAQKAAQARTGASVLIGVICHSS